MPAEFAIDLVPRFGHPSVHYGCSSHFVHVRLRRTGSGRIADPRVLDNIHAGVQDASSRWQERGHRDRNTPAGARRQVALLTRAANGNPCEPWGNTVHSAALAALM